MPPTNALKARFMDAYFGATALSPPANLFFALSTTTPTDTGTNFTRPSGGSYADVSEANDGVTWAAATVADPSEKTNDIIVEFPTPTASWGEVTHVGVAETDGGTVTWWEPLANPVTIGPGSEPVRIPVGGLVLRARKPSA